MDAALSLALLLAALVAQQGAPPIPGDGLGWVQWVGNVGVLGLVFGVFFFKVMPKILKRHEQSLEKQETRHESSGTRQRTDFKDALNTVVTDHSQGRKEFMEALAAERAGREVHTITLTKVEAALRENTGAIKQMTKTGLTGNHAAMQALQKHLKKEGD